METFGENIKRFTLSILSYKVEHEAVKRDNWWLRNFIEQLVSMVKRARVPATRRPLNEYFPDDFDIELAAYHPNRD